jgi:hypothetical protein
MQAGISADNGTRMKHKERLSDVYLREAGRQAGISADLLVCYL